MPRSDGVHQATTILTFETAGPGLVEITRPVAEWVGTARQGAEQGLLSLLCQHSSASLTIQENADPAVGADLEATFARLAPQGGREIYSHHSEGPDDMAAHIRTVLSGVHLSIPLIAGRLALGTWQGIWLWEHRNRGRRRQVASHLLAS